MCFVRAAAVRVFEIYRQLLLLAGMPWHIIVEIPACDGVPLVRDYREHCVCWNEYFVLVDWVCETEAACRAISRYWFREYPDLYVVAQCTQLDQ